MLTSCHYMITLTLNKGPELGEVAPPRPGEPLQPQPGPGARRGREGGEHRIYLLDRHLNTDVALDVLVAHCWPP